MARVFEVTFTLETTEPLTEAEATTLVIKALDHLPLDAADYHDVDAMHTEDDEEAD